MKIDFYISSLSGGGAEKVLVTLAEEFANKNHETSIYSLECRPQFYAVSPNVMVEKISDDCQPQGLCKEFRSIRKRLKKRNADVVVSFLSRCNLLVLASSLFRKQKIIVCDRNNPIKEHSMRMFHLSCQLYRLASAIIVQTQQIKDFYPSYLQDKIYVLENPLDVEKLTGECRGQDITPENTIISIGRLEPQKDFVTLIKAFSQIAEKYKDWQLRIFGKGEQRDELQALIDDLNLSNSVQLCGRTETPFLELCKSKVFVLSSNYEGFPNALCEGMLAGLACVSSDCVSGPRELINDGENGFLFPVGDADKLAEMLELLLSSQDLREGLGAKAQNSVKRLELSTICDKWYKILKSISEKQ